MAERLNEALIFHNPWWVTERVPEVLSPAYERPVINRLISYLDLERIVILKGPRRTGKTTLMYQMIKRLINDGVDPKRILFLSFDDIEARETIEDIIQAYEQICRAPVSASEKGIFYFIFDEIHFWENWQFYLKKYFDKKYPIKFMATSSAATLARKDGESLMGRTVEELILPFDFFEYVSYRHYSKPIIEAIESLRNRYSLAGREMPDITEVLPYKKEILIAFREYLEKGGFPHILSVNEPIIWKRLLRDDIVGKAIYRDLVRLYEIRKPQILEKMLLYLADITGQLLNLSNLSNSMRISREYTERYLEYLKQAYLVTTIKRFAPSMEKRLRSGEKAYLIDSGLLTSLGINDEARAIEALLCRHLMSDEIYYWRDGFEVDFVIKRRKEITPVEVKFREKPRLKDLKGVLQFAERYKSSLAKVVTKNDLKEETINGVSLHLIPAWTALLISG